MSLMSTVFLSTVHLFNESILQIKHQIDIWNQCREGDNDLFSNLKKLRLTFFFHMNTSYDSRDPQAPDIIYIFLIMKKYTPLMYYYRVGRGYFFLRKISNVRCLCYVHTFNNTKIQYEQMNYHRVFYIICKVIIDRV